MNELTLDHLVLRYCHQIVMQAMDQHPQHMPFIAAKEPALAEQVLRLLKST